MDYTSVAEQALLGRLHLVSSTFRVRPTFFATDTLTLRLSTTWSNESYDAQRTFGICEWACHVYEGGAAENQKHPKEETLLSSGAQYVIEYDNVGMDGEAATAYLRDVGRMATYPYFRAHVAMLQSASNVVLPPLPPINIATFRARAAIFGEIRNQGSLITLEP